MGGGSFAWKCEAPPEEDDSSGAAELRVVTSLLEVDGFSEAPEAVLESSNISLWGCCGTQR